MQDEGIGWDPIVDRVMPWQSKLLVLFLALVAVVVIVKLIKALLASQKRWRAESEELALMLWSSATFLLTSVKKWLKLALLVTGFATANVGAERARELSFSKIGSPGVVHAGIAEVLVLLQLGLLVVVLGYAGCMGCEWLLNRRRVGAKTDSVV